MKTREELNNIIYIITPGLLFLYYVFICNAKFSIFGSMAITYSLLGIWLIIDAAIGKWIKKWIRSEDTYKELFSCELPVFVFIFIANEGSNTIAVFVAFLSVLVSVAYYIFSVRFNLKGKSRGDQNYAEYVEKVKAISLHRSRYLLAILVGVCVAAPMIGRPIIGTYNKANLHYPQDYTLTIPANIDYLKVLTDEAEFRKKTAEEKQEIFQMIVDIESSSQHIPYRIITKSQMLNPDVLASFKYEDGCIVINKDYLSWCTGKDLIDTACHEVRHAYQWEITLLYTKLKRRHDDESIALLDDVIGDSPIYSKEFTAYKNSGASYYRQKCERDARTYASKRCEVWMDTINSCKESDV